SSTSGEILRSDGSSFMTAVRSLESVSRSYPGCVFLSSFPECNVNPGTARTLTTGRPVRRVPPSSARPEDFLLDLGAANTIFTYSYMQSELQAFKAAFFRALAHPVRIRILEVLGAGERSVHDLQQALGLEQPLVSQQLAVLRSKNIVTPRKVGTTVRYALS